nr:MAG TPA: hypothetical protein [Caudoviricetes sp.]
MADECKPVGIEIGTIPKRETAQKGRRYSQFLW